MLQTFLRRIRELKLLRLKSRQVVTRTKNSNSYRQIKYLSTDVSKRCNEEQVAELNGDRRIFVNIDEQLVREANNKKEPYQRLKKSK